MVERLYEHILVPTNFLSADRAAYRLALALAQPSQSRITLLHVIPEEPDEAYSGLDAIKLMHRAAEGGSSPLGRARKLTAERREALSARLRSELHSEWLGSLPVVTEVRSGDALDEIARAIEELQVDLVVLASPRPTWAPRFGRSVAERLARRTEAKIVTVLPPARTPA
jgi:nucleotide-binding universal stress UspA family protein